MVRQSRETESQNGADIFRSSKCELKFTPVTNARLANGRRQFQIHSTEAIDTSHESNETPHISRDAIASTQSTLPITYHPRLPRQKVIPDNRAEWRLYQARLHARKREQAEIALFKRIHIPESTQKVSFWQVSIVVFLLLARIRRVVPTPRTSMSSSKPPIRLSFEQQSRLLKYSGRSPTTYNSYRKKSKLGRGASAIVYRAEMVPNGRENQHVFESGAPFVAIKQIRISQQWRPDMIINEVAIMSQCKHPNIIDFYNVVWQVGDDYIWIVMEYADCGALTDLIYFSLGLREDQIALLCREVGSF
jgi:hypothetical protein